MTLGFCFVSVCFFAGTASRGFDGWRQTVTSVNPAAFSAASVLSALFPEAAVWPGALLAAETQPAVAELLQIPLRHADARRDSGQHQIKDRGLGVHDTAGQSHDGRAVIKIAQQEHRPRQHR